MSLENILEISSSCLASISNGRYDELEGDISRCGRLLTDYLHANHISGLDARQLSILRRIHSNHQQALKLIEERKQEFACHISTLQRGRKMEKIYSG